MSTSDPSDEAMAVPKAEPTAEVGRGLPSINRSRTLQQRVSQVLALTLVGAVGVIVLTGYYAHFAHPSMRASSRGSARAFEGEMVLPPLGAIPGASASATPSRYVIGNIAGDPPPLGNLRIAEGRGFEASAAPPGAAPPDRRLTGAAFVTAEVSGAVAEPTASGGVGSGSGATATSFSQQLATSVTPAIRARRLPSQRLLLPRGAFIDCTLETAVDSTLAGLVTCLTATDTFGADGRVVLLERGTRLVGETRGEVRSGMARVYIVWTEARTPTGVVAELDSPATDALGRAGVAGVVERHFWERFGAAMLLSTIDGAIQAAASRQGSGTTVVAGGSATSEILGEVLKGTINIAPTIRIAAGSRVQALVARDIDFRSVYELRDASTHQ